MAQVLQPWQLLVVVLAGWINEHQQAAVEYLSLLLTPSALSTLNLCSGRSTMASMMSMIREGLLLAFRTRHSLVLENLALRHQIAVLQRSSKRPRLKMRDRVFWVLLSRTWSGWRDSLSFVKPETVIRWHRKGFRLYWTWKSRRTGHGRPAVSGEVRELIRKMSRANPLWGAPRLHGELEKLGIDISQATVSKYMVRPRKPPSQTWRAFLDNHVENLVSIEVRQRFERLHRCANLSHP